MTRPDNPKLRAKIKMRKVRHQDARRALRVMWHGCKVLSCADGTLRIEPQWKGRPYTPKGGGGPGLFSRLHAANMVETVLGLPKRK